MPTRKADVCGYDVNELPFHIGDHVVIDDLGKIYPTYSDWVTENVKDNYLAALWKYGEDPKYSDDIYEIVAIAPHEYHRTTLVYIHGIHNNECYIISQSGLLLVNKVPTRYEVIEDNEFSDFMIAF